MHTTLRNALVAILFVLAVTGLTGAMIWLPLVNQNDDAGDSAGASRSIAARADVGYAESTLGTVVVPRPVSSPSGMTRDDWAELARTNPAEFVFRAHEHYLRNVQGYRCLLIKQERLGGKLSPVQEVELRVRERPRMVYMLWRKNEGDCRRALFIDDPRYRNADGVMQARVEPAGAIARLFVRDLMVPIRGKLAEGASRRTIDECGFRPFFEIFREYYDLAVRHGHLDIQYGGVGQIDGRPTYILVRHLPYTGESCIYPDGRLIIHMDQEWLVPTGAYSYADRAEKQLLGSYLFTRVELNPLFSPDDFEF